MWSGVIQRPDDALQLLLIVDYVTDWARSIYRESIKRQLKSLATGMACDEVSLIDEGDTLRLPASNSACIAPPANSGTDHTCRVDQHHPSSVSQGAGSRVIAYHDHEVHALRAASLVEYRVIGLFISTSNLTSFLELIVRQQHYDEGLRAAARHILRILKRQGPSLQVEVEVMLAIEAFWVRRKDSIKAHPFGKQTSHVYANIEFATFIDVRWNIIQEMTYVAVSQRAFANLVELSGFAWDDEPVKSMMDFCPCSADVFNTAVSCLRSGSTMQIFLAAVSRSNFTLFPVFNNDIKQPRSITRLGLRIIRRSSLRKPLSELNESEQCRKNGFCKTTQTLLAKCSNQDTTWDYLSQPYMDSSVQTQQVPQEDPSPCIIRMKDSVYDVSTEVSHAESSCQRCLRRDGHAGDKRVRTTMPFWDTPYLLLHIQTSITSYSS